MYIFLRTSKNILERQPGTLIDTSYFHSLSISRSIRERIPRTCCPGRKFSIFMYCGNLPTALWPLPPPSTAVLLTLDHLNTLQTPRYEPAIIQNNPSTVRDPCIVKFSGGYILLGRVERIFQAKCGIRFFVWSTRPYVTHIGPISIVRRLWTKTAESTTDHGVGLIIG